VLRLRDPVVLDTNVIASGIVGFRNSGSAPAQILHAWQAGYFLLATSEHILTELSRTLSTAYFQQRLSAQDVAQALQLLHADTTLVAITTPVQGVATQPEDDLVVATALSGGAAYLVTGDRQLLRLNTYQGITILNPRAFLGLLASQQP
jgi:putative PIN family toxin of toxin-antitoxin system